jgi:hypothetical protein
MARTLLRKPSFSKQIKIVLANSGRVHPEKLERMNNNEKEARHRGLAPPASDKPRHVRLD